MDHRFRGECHRVEGTRGFEESRGRGTEYKGCRDRGIRYRGSGNRAARDRDQLDGQTDIDGA